MKKIGLVLVFWSFAFNSYADYEVLKGDVDAPQGHVEIYRDYACKIDVIHFEDHQESERKSLELEARNVNEEGKVVLVEYDGFDNYINVEIIKYSKFYFVRIDNYENDFFSGAHSARFGGRFKTLGNLNLFFGGSHRTFELICTGRE